MQTPIILTSINYEGVIHTGRELYWNTAIWGPNCYNKVRMDGEGDGADDDDDDDDLDDALWDGGDGDNDFPL